MTENAPIEIVETEDGDHGNAATETLDEQAIPVKLRFEAGRLTLPMSELSRVHAGYVFNLSKPVDREVIDIFANDTRIATGELVLVGDTVGVRLSSINPRGR